MGLNDYNSYDKKKVDKFTSQVNEERATRAKKGLHAATEKLAESLDPMRPLSSIPEQSKAIMEIEYGEGYSLTMVTRDLGRQHDQLMKALDIGTFTGDSAGSIALGMQENGGTVITCDSTREYQETAEEYWRKEGVRDHIDYRITDAHALLDQLVNDPAQRGTFDLVFIDAEKPGYRDYYAKALQLVRPGGKIIFDNMLLSGRVADPSNDEADICTMRRLVEDLTQDQRIDFFLQNSGDGWGIAEKRNHIRNIQRSPAQMYKGPLGYY